MWSEEWDNKFRDAAGQVDKSANPEKGWERMEPLLDKHLPKKQRGFTLLLLFLIAGLLGTTVMLRSRNSMKEDKQVNLHNQHSSQHSTADESISKSTFEEMSPTPSIKPENPTNPPSGSGPEPASAGTTPTIPFNINRSESVKNQPLRPHLLSTTNAPIREKIEGDESVTRLPVTSSYAPGNPGADIPTNKQSGLLTWPYGSLLKTLQGTEKDDWKISNTHLRSNPLKKEGRPNTRWSISLMGGSDISAARWRRAGEWRSAWGLAIGYDIRPNLTLRAGLIRSRKIYSAGPEDYKMYDQFWTYASELNKVDANCLVYEIPVSILYHFRNKGKGNWFASAGFASVLMKKEDYEFDYKDLAGQQRYSSRSWSNYSNHIFAAVQLSGGYRYPLSKKFSISAEPYIKIPVTGIGYGDVKLRGAGMLISVSYR